MANPESSTPTADSQVFKSMRRSLRHLCIDGGAMRLTVHPEFRNRTAILIDVSTGGIGFIVEGEVEVGAVVAFELKAPNGNDIIGRIARVRNCRPCPPPPDAPWMPPTPIVIALIRRVLGVQGPQVDGHAWRVGCQFDRPLEEKELQLFLDSLQADPDEEVW